MPKFQPTKPKGGRVFFHLGKLAKIVAVLVKIHLNISGFVANSPTTLRDQAHVFLYPLYVASGMRLAVDLLSKSGKRDAEKRWLSAE